jgi:hypothetical protein
MSQQQRTFEWSTHERFARISCDCNPIHMDAVAARRTHVGAPIVHGIHSLIWMLDCIAQAEPAASAARTVIAQFLQPVYVGDRATVDISRPTEQSIRARALVGTTEVAVVSLGFDAPLRAPQPVPQDSHCMPPPTRPQERTLDDVERLSGSLSFGPASSEIAEMFPNAVRGFGMQRIAALLSTSCLIGMIVPGLHSIFSGLEVTLDGDQTPTDQLLFAVTSVVRRFRLVRISVAAPGLRGSLESVCRMPPMKQPDLDKILPLVSRNDFHGSTALVIGGSRGLGELTSKLVAAGGSRVVLTYRTGKSDADALVAELRAAGLNCAAVPYDVRRPAAEQLAELDVIPTHVYYFATPLIFRRKAGLFDAERFAEFNAYYVAGFFDLLQSCVRLRPAGLRVFYPSTIFVENRPANMTEYSMSKAAAEILCTDLKKFVPGVQIVIRRLPRLPTDQTNSVAGTTAIDPTEVMLPIIREMHARDATAGRELHVPARTGD